MFASPHLADARTKFGRHLATLGRSRPNFRQHGPHVIDFGRTRTNNGRTRTNVGRCWANVGRFRASFGRSPGNLFNSVGLASDPAQIRQTWGRHGSNSAAFGPSVPKVATTSTQIAQFSQTRPNRGCFRAPKSIHFDRSLTRIGQNCPDSDQHACLVFSAPFWCPGGVPAVVPVCCIGVPAAAPLVSVFLSQLLSRWCPGLCPAQNKYETKDSAAKNREPTTRYKHRRC